MLDFGGPGMIMLGSAEHATHSGYITFTFTEDNDIADGEYFIRNKLTGKYMQADGDNLVRTGNGTGSNNQIWQITGGASGALTADEKAELSAISDDLNAQKDRFGAELEFGTAEIGRAHV